MNHLFSQKLLLLVVLVKGAARLIAESGAETAKSPANVAGAEPSSASLSFQYQAMGKYPELARAGSSFNEEFLRRVRHLLATNREFFLRERWPVELADEVAADGFPTALARIIPDASALPPKSPVPMPVNPNLTGRGVSAPSHAPDVVHAAVAAGNLLQNKPYKWGGGHGRLEDSGYDCSGSVSYVLRKAGLLSGALTSRGFASYGNPGPGRWITIYSGPGHAFMTVCGLRLDTGGSRGLGESGPRWSPVPRHTRGFIARHPPGL